MTRRWIAALSLWCAVSCLPARAATWYVRVDGGTRFTSKMPSGQCDGLADSAYKGSGVNQHCAFKDVRYLWQDGSYTTDARQSAFPSYGWVGTGGDTYLIKGSIEDRVSYRVGWNNNANAFDAPTAQRWGVQGNPYASPPPPFSGTAGRHTRILGGNYASCHGAGAKTQLHGGYAITSVLDLSGASYVDVACMDLTDFSGCGRAAQTFSCNTNPGTIDDYATFGIAWSNTSTHDTVTDVHIHGLANAGMSGPTGDGVVLSYVDLIGNASSGWNADNGNHTTGWGSLRVDHYNISWNGCAEEYPATHALPYADCTDDNTGGYGDGFGTATIESTPGWVVVFDQGVVSYNTQDGLDALHLVGRGSSMTVTHTLAYGNMGQQLKVGGAQGIFRDNVVYTNCNALRQAIPGTPPKYNARLSDFCRAADGGIKITVNDGSTTYFERNIVYSASATALEVEINATCATSTCLIQQRNNIFVGFENNAANGYAGGGTGNYSNPVYVEEARRVYRNAGSSFDHNITYHPSSEWSCPNSSLHETHAVCANPHLADESWHVYGYGDTTRTARTTAAASEQGTSAAAESAVEDGPPEPFEPRRFRLRYVGVPLIALGTWGIFRRFSSRSPRI